MKTSELTGAALDWAVAKCEDVDIDKWGTAWVKAPKQPHFNEEFRPSTDWAQGGLIIEREKIYGPEPLISAMRYYVASKLGDEIEVPEELK